MEFFLFVCAASEIRLGTLWHTTAPMRHAFVPKCRMSVNDTLAYYIFKYLIISG